MVILLIDNGSKHLRAITKILGELRVRFVVKKQNGFFNFPKGIRGVILSGGGPSLTGKIKLGSIRLDLAALELGVPVLGICEGLEIIALAFGGEVKLLKKPAHFQNLTVKVKRRNKIFKDLEKEITVYTHHSKYISKVPPWFNIAASSRKDVVEAIFHKTKPVFGVQFHPEKSESGKKIIQNFTLLCK